MTKPGQSPSPDRAPTLARLRTLVAAVIRRQRLADATWGLTRVALPAGLLIAAAAIASARLLALGPDAVWALAWLGLAPVPGVLLWAWLRPRSARAAARRLDRHYDLQDRIGNAIELLEQPPPRAEDPRTIDIVALVADDAEQAARELDPRPVVSLKPPGLRALDLLAAAALALAILVPIPQATRAGDPGPAAGELVGATVEQARARAKVDMALAEPLREDLRRLQGKDDAASRMADAVLEILDAFGAGELDREAAFASLEELEEELAEAEDAFTASIEEDPAMLAEGVRRMAEALKEHEITREAGEALARGDEDAFEEAMRRALERAEESAASQRELDKAMQEAERALKKAGEQQRSTSDKLAEAERRLKREQKKSSDDPEEQERRLKKQEQLKERVEQLRRQHEREAAARRKLEELRRQAQQAGGKGKGGQKQRSMQKLSRGASGASKAGRQGRRLGQSRDNLEEAKKFIRRAGKQGDKQNRRKQQMQRFAKAAKGKKGKKGKNGQKGKNGPTLLVEGDIGDGDPDEMFMMEGDDGQGQPQPGDGQDGQDGGQGKDGQNGDGQSGQSVAVQGGDSYGDGSQDPLGDAKGIKAKARNVRVNAKEGKGATRAEIISTASQDGFASVDYTDVYRDYRSFAQNAMDRETMPAPQRRKIKRYFQMIQPRE